ncbi:MAG TPA: glycine--tRNA ligase subunit beta, partial [Candidatus Olsenella stercoravium]|nr:glycine--tRNA ligase subunit beta [Candidatus Olsenella stercoravium]
MADTRDFLLEIGTEEMPSAPLMNAAQQLGGLVAKGLDAAGLAHGEVRVISTPRRLAALVSDVAVATDEIHEVKRGPKAAIAFDEGGRPTKAALGFARKCGADAADLVRRVDADG